MRSIWTLQDAKNKFSEVVSAANGGRPQFVSKRGKLAVVVLDAREYERLAENDERNGMTFGQALLSMPQGNWENDPNEGTLKMRNVEF